MKVLGLDDKESTVIEEVLNTKSVEDKCTQRGSRILEDAML